jgi:hypothetical protein
VENARVFVRITQEHLPKKVLMHNETVGIPRQPGAAPAGRHRSSSRPGATDARR